LASNPPPRTGSAKRRKTPHNKKLSTISPVLDPFAKPSANDGYLRTTAIDHRQTNVGFQGNIAERSRAISIALFDRGHCLAGHPSEGGDSLFKVQRLRRELAVP